MCLKMHQFLQTMQLQWYIPWSIYCTQQESLWHAAFVQDHYDYGLRNTKRYLLYISIISWPRGNVVKGIICSREDRFSDSHLSLLDSLHSILVAAGALKRSDPGMQEDILLYRTIRDMQLPWVLWLRVFRPSHSDCFAWGSHPFLHFTFSKALEVILSVSCNLTYIFPGAGSW